MRSRSDESGFTLIEMIVVCAIGSIVMLACLQLADLAIHSTARTTERADAAQRGRTAMEQLQQALRSQVCVKSSVTSSLAPVAYGDGQKLAFFNGDVSPSGAGTTAFQPDERTYELSNGSIVEKRYASTGTYPAISFPGYPATPTSTRGVITDVVEPAASALFTYYTLAADGTIDEANPLPVPLSDTDRTRIAQVRIQFVARPTDKSSEKLVQVAFDDRVTTRLAFTPPVAGASNPIWTVSCPI